jgi:hypothetical protein
MGKKEKEIKEMKEVSHNKLILKKIAKLQAKLK